MAYDDNRQKNIDTKGIKMPFNGNKTGMTKGLAKHQPTPMLSKNFKKSIPAPKK